MDYTITLTDEQVAVLTAHVSAVNRTRPPGTPARTATDVLTSLAVRLLSRRAAQVEQLKTAALARKIVTADPETRASVVDLLSAKARPGK
ncbi:MAG: hypothetical protein AB7Q29_13485 [Vicinamibacterales bacterium]